MDRCSHQSRFQKVTEYMTPLLYMWVCLYTHTSTHSKCLGGFFIQDRLIPVTSETQQKLLFIFFLLSQSNMGLQGGPASLGRWRALAPSVSGSTVPQSLKSPTGSSASSHQKTRQWVWTTVRAGSQGGTAHFYPYMLLATMQPHGHPNTSGKQRGAAWLCAQQPVFFSCKETETAKFQSA